jgi:acyl dehydratase
VTAGAAPTEVGHHIPEMIDGPLTRTDFVRYQGASGDMNPIHHDDGFARAHGYPSVFAVGMRQAGVLGTLLADLYGAEHVRRFGVRFLEQAWPGDTLRYSGRVTHRRGAEGVRELDLELVVERVGGGPHLRGWATVTLPSP